MPDISETPDATAAGAAPPTEPAGSPDTQPDAGPSFADALRAQEQGDGDPDVKAGDAAPQSADEPAPAPGDVKSGRRSAAAQENLTRIAELERQLAERDPAQVRERVLAELEAEKAKADEDAAVKATADADAEAAARYERLRDLPDRDLSDEDYRWREEHKAKLAAFPEHRRAVLAEAERVVTQREEAGWNRLKAQYAAWTDLPGVDKALIERSTDLYLTGKHLYETGEARARADLQPKLDAALEEVRRLKAEAGQFRLNGRGGLAAARAPISGGGRSGPSAPAIPEGATTTDLFAAAIRRTRDGAD